MPSMRSAESYLDSPIFFFPIYAVLLAEQAQLFVGGFSSGLNDYRRQEESRMQRRYVFSKRSYSPTDLDVLYTVHRLPFRGMAVLLTFALATHDKQYGRKGQSDQKSGPGSTPPRTVK